MAKKNYMQQKAEAEKLEFDKLEAKKLELEKANAERLVSEAEIKKAEDFEKAAKKSNDIKYEVAVTGFYQLGKMFRPETKIDGKIHKDYLQDWLKRGYIRVKK